jgi:hypothetical protein
MLILLRFFCRNFSEIPEILGTIQGFQKVSGIIPEF